MLQHPQMFGPTMGLLATWLFASWLTAPTTSLLRRAVFFLALAWIYLSQARIGALVFLAGALAAITTGPLSAALNKYARIPRIRGGRLVVVVVSLIILGIVAGPSIASRAQEFLGKGRTAESIRDAALTSRGFLIEEMMVNIRAKPMVGIGLGIASDLDKEQMVVRDPYFGIAIMAPVEKGVLPIAMVEEFGAPLAILYGIWFGILLLNAIKGGVVNGSLCVAALIFNVAEAVFFSPGGCGMLDLTVAAMAATAGLPAAHSRR